MDRVPESSRPATGAGPEAGWTPSSWRARPRSQQPPWPDPVALDAITDALRRVPVVVPPVRASRLRSRLAAAATGRSSVLQAGPCVESFRDDPAVAVDGLAQVLDELAAALAGRADAVRRGRHVIRVARAAGQYAKPRSAETEFCAGRHLPAFRGHLVNDDAPAEAGRRPDPWRLVTGRTRSAETVRRLSAIAPALFVSHEALVLEYEEALTRRDPLTGRWYAGSGDLLWVGERTRQLDGAHVEFLSGIANPVGCKLGPTATPEEVVELCARLDPARSPGRLTLVPRLGADRVGDLLPPLVRAVAAAGHPVVWLCDPMHGNTRIGPGGKWRSVADIRAEVARSYEVHTAQSSWLAGLHLEVTAEDVAECTDGEPTAGSAPRRTTSLCDPRLNAAQAQAVVQQLVACSRARCRPTLSPVLREPVRYHGDADVL